MNITMNATSPLENSKESESLPSDTSLLLSHASSAGLGTHHSQRRISSYCRPLSILLWTLVFLFVCGVAVWVTKEPKRLKEAYYIFPSDFVWGVATSAYQIEGAFDEDGRRGPNATIWDTFVRKPGNVLDNSTGDVADDHYHRVESDVALMKSLNIKAYRFSIAWSRILPNGTGDVNPAGVAFYSHLIDTLIATDIEPFVTLFHWDLPQTLEDYGGWLGIETTDAFVEYARVCFENFGDRVSRWITLNEAWTVSVNGYASGIHAPGHTSPTEPYIVGHHLLLAHAKAARLYKSEYAFKNKGMIGISNCGDYRYPLTDSKTDHEAAERAMAFQMGWFTDPVMLGKYPDAMRERLGSRLPEISKAEQKLIQGSADFIGLNYYSAFMAWEPRNEASYDGFWAHIFVGFSDDPSWEHNDMGWNVVPDGLRSMLFWIQHRYNDPVIYVTENGSAEKEANLGSAKNDTKRRDYFEGHLTACAKAISAGVKLKGYFAWSFMDNFEWQFGYTKRFGLCYVDYKTQTRTPKMSAQWYRNTIAAGKIRRASVPDKSIDLEAVP